MGKTEERDPLLRYVHARADSSDRQATREANDPEELRARLAERRLLRLLIAMVLVIVVGGFVISIVGLILTGGTAQ
jgi:hypothetical protein